MHCLPVLYSHAADEICRNIDTAAMNICLPQHQMFNITHPQGANHGAFIYILHVAIVKNLSNVPELHQNYIKMIIFPCEAFPCTMPKKTCFFVACSGHKRKPSNVPWYQVEIMASAGDLMM